LEEGIALQRGAMNRDLYVHMDLLPDGGTRLTYVTLQGSTVTAFVNLVPVDPIEKRPCFMIGYAVPQAFRGQGLAKAAVRAALAEMEVGFSRAGLAPFFIEAIVGADNLASQAVAAATLSDTPEAVTDEFSGQPAYQYVRKLGG
jgi:hypothetical protein